MAQLNLPKNRMQRNRGKQQNGKDQRSLQKIRDTKGTFHAKMGSRKDRNGMDLTETEDIKKRCQEQQGELRKPSLAINAKKQRKTTEWERLLERKLEIPREHFMQRWA